MKVKVLTDVTIECDPPRHIGYWGGDVEKRAREMESWAREFEAFVRDHRSQDPVSLVVQRKYEEQCSHCGYGWEEDADGPICCDAAQKEWEAAKVA